MASSDVRLALTSLQHTLQAIATPQAQPNALALAAAQGYPWEGPMLAGRLKLTIGIRLPRVAILRMNEELNAFRDWILDHPEEPWVDISDSPSWRGYVANHIESVGIIGPGVVWAGYVGVLDEVDYNHPPSVVDLLLVQCGGRLVRMHPRVAANKTPVMVRDGRVREYFRGWECTATRPAHPAVPPAPHAAQGQPLASPQGAGSSAEVRQVVQGAGSSTDEGRVLLWRPAADVPVYPDKNAEARAATLRVPSPWIAYYDEAERCIWVSHPQDARWAWWPHGPT